MHTGLLSTISGESNVNIHIVASTNGGVSGWLGLVLHGNFTLEWSPVTTDSCCMHFERDPLSMHIMHAR